MAGYLDQYGVGEEKRSRVIKGIAFAVVAVLVVGGIFYWYFQTFSQEREVRRFFALLAAHDYAGAYKLWGCSKAQPCRDYPMQEFMKDWGPQAVAQPGAAHITNAESCGSGVIVKVAAPGAESKTLWVERATATLGYSPVEICPNRSPLKIMSTRLRDRIR